jgi:hypothetical protein
MTQHQGIALNVTKLGLRGHGFKGRRLGVYLHESSMHPLYSGFALLLMHYALHAQTTGACFYLCCLFCLSDDVLNVNFALVIVKFHANPPCLPCLPTVSCCFVSLLRKLYMHFVQVNEPGFMDS